MQKRILLLSLVMVIAVVGGILAEKWSQSKQNHKVIVEQAPKSKLKVENLPMPEIEKTNSKVLIGYVQDFRDPNTIDYAKFTQIIFSFAHPLKDGGVLLNGDMALKNLRAMVSQAKKYHTKVILGVGGWFHIKGGESYPYFKAAISNPTSRAKLVSALTSLVDREHLDGIDIDFEHPHSAADANNLSAFIKALGGQLHSQNKELSVAVYSKINAATLTVTGFVVYDPKMFQYVDHVNIMAYDGQWDGGYHAANLSTYTFAEKIVNYWSGYFDHLHLSKGKLVLGVPLYGQPENPKIKQVSFSAILHNNPNNALKDSVIMNGTTYYYNSDTTMINKTRLTLDHGFGGMMLWEAGLDAKGPTSVTATIFSALQKFAKEPVKYYAVKSND
ncbi:glycoside hydrolase family 18 protein [Bacillus sp. BRMEA1]|uniref:glycoside hydrolase family 18 protein n=1 Tax=Neobacillus endophyticus TaxID=2738405 RepID=UPI001565DE39|nr:glycoside hydrolase family 18 protein [Neobacillus endophyticus]NRD79624.1 glycoside hydrolase family 18 protein [Neobacillus endophyticus]